MACFYNQKNHCVQKMTREHVISNAVLKVAFGNPIRNVARAEKFGNKILIDHEAVVKDVCEKCNNFSLSSYDVAGKNLAIHLENQKNKNIPLEIIFDLYTLGWIVKTHLNYTRIIKDRETEKPYKVKQEIKNKIIHHNPLTSDNLSFLVQQWQEDNEYWDAESPKKIQYLSYRSIRFRSQCIVMSNFRIRQLDTIIMIPSDGSYKNFDKRVKSATLEMRTSFNADFQEIDIENSLNRKIIKINSLFSIREIEAIKQTHNLMD